MLILYSNSSHVKSVDIASSISKIAEAGFNLLFFEGTIYEDILLVQFTRLSSNCLKNFFVLSSISLPFASNLSCANVTITSGLLIGYMFKNTHVWRRWN